MRIIIRCIPMAVIAIWTLIRFVTGKDRANIKVWLLIAAALFGLFANTFLFFGFPGYADAYFAGISLLDIGFILAAIAALTNKRVCGLLSAICIWMLTAMNTIGCFAFVNLLWLAWMTVWVGLAIWQFKRPKEVPLWVWIILAVPGLLNSLRIASLLLLALLVWLSAGTTQGKIEVHKKTVLPQPSHAELSDKLKALEALQELLDSGVITQEEFDKKKNQILG